MPSPVGPRPIDLRRLTAAARALAERIETARPDPVAGPPRRQRILITGASSGIGSELARVWAADGRTLALCARRVDRLEALADELRTAHPDVRVETYQLDVTDPGAVDFVLSAAADQLGGLDRVVANAGIGKGAPVGTGYDWANRATLQTNAVGALNTAEKAVQLFRAAGPAGGHLVLVSSIAALRGMGGARTGYAASKAAVSALGEGLRSELRGTPITVSVVHPGYIDTAINARDAKKKWSLPLDRGGRMVAAAIDGERPVSWVPPLPWELLAAPLRVVPLDLFRRILD
ncbi:short-subunit dehydrogenase [Friedmanniella endophytica]|uniref:Short-subunit dehydrogenase n=1 Tax=Microlunatus kandeliicorticis TaxID=1759536 RepID=A0A7W3P5G2_9ACTN|nr:SDR family oxidoreductase [Microlunatus kandeliicorticis]MBA8793830.1 short-subunit dehydrogenase [Microlunatus kandeliicorticis]